MNAGDPTPQAVPPLAGRRALVTGGAGGIGSATARRLANAGASVCVNYIGEPAPAEELARELRRDGERALAIEADISDEPQVTEMFARAASEFGGPIDVLVNNAGVQAPFSLLEMPLEEWNRVLSVNLTGAFLCSREAARALVDTGAPGVIVNVSSVHELLPWPRFSHYCASKSALKLFGQTVARELAPHRIRLAGIAPGAIVTPINEDVLEEDRERHELERQIPWGRMGTAEEVAAAIAWLAGPEAEYTTGATLFLDGGMTLYDR